MICRFCVHFYFNFDLCVSAIAAFDSSVYSFSPRVSRGRQAGWLLLMLKNQTWSEFSQEIKDLCPWCPCRTHWANVDNIQKCIRRNLIKTSVHWDFFFFFACCLLKFWLHFLKDSSIIAHALFHIALGPIILVCLQMVTKGSLGFLLICTDEQIYIHRPRGWAHCQVEIALQSERDEIFMFLCSINLGEVWVEKLKQAWRRSGHKLMQLGIFHGKRRSRRDSVGM